MINRRDFLKLSGFALVALGSGVGVGKLTGNRRVGDITLAALLPDDPRMISRVIGELTGEAGLSVDRSNVLLLGESALLGRLRQAGFSQLKIDDPRFILSLSRIPAGNLSDIFIKTGDHEILSPESSFSASLKNLRAELKMEAASLMLTLRPAPTEMSAGERFAVVTSEGKEIERIPLSGTSREIYIYGGNVVAAGGGRAFIKKHGCKHGICAKMGHAAVPGDIIACAPHKMTVTVV